MIDETEFLRFFHRLLERPDLNELFEKVSNKYKGKPPLATDYVPKHKDDNKCRHIFSLGKVVFDHVPAGRSRHHALRAPGLLEGHPGPGKDIFHTTRTDVFLVN